MFSGTGSGKTPQAPSDPIMTTVLMQRERDGGLKIRFYHEDTSKTYLPGNYLRKFGTTAEIIPVDTYRYCSTPIGKQASCRRAV